MAATLGTRAETYLPTFILSAYVRAVTLKEFDRDIAVLVSTCYSRPSYNPAQHKTWRTRHFDRLEQRFRLGLAEYFEFILTSAELSIRKPNPLLFEMAATRLGVAPSAIWFVGDRLDADVVGANAAGMTSVMLGTRAPSTYVTDTPAIRIADWRAWPFEEITLAITNPEVQG